MKINTPILVTGAAGFIGSHLCKALLDENYTVIAIDDLSLGNRNNLPKNKKLIFRKCDLIKKEGIARIIAHYKPQLIYHLAAWAHEGLSQFMPSQITKSNYNAFLNLITPAINYKVKKVIVFSSMSVYGNQKAPFSESLPRKPVDIYGIAKSAIENAVEVLSGVYGFNYVIVRPHNVYGPQQSMTDPYRNVVAIFINRLLQKKAFYIYGDGNQKRAFTYIDDLIPSVVTCGLNEQINNAIYNLGPREEYTINYLAQIILQQFELKLKPHYLPDRPAEVTEAFCTSEKAEKELGYYTKTNLEEGISKTIRWAKTVGYQKPIYLKQIEINSKLLPKTWRDKLI